MSHKPDIDSINKAAAQLIKTSDPQEAKLVSDKLREVNDRYQKVGDSSSRHGDVLRSLVDQVESWESQVEQLEDWELPLIESINAQTMGQMETPQLNRKLKV